MDSPLGLFSIIVQLVFLEGILSIDNAAVLGAMVGAVGAMAVGGGCGAGAEAHPACQISKANRIQMNDQRRLVR